MVSFEYRGKKTGMLFGVSRLVLQWRDSNPGIDISFLWEGRDSWRKRAHSIYKANRKGDYNSDDRDEFFDCVERVRDALPSMGVRQIVADSYEADDLAYSLSMDTGLKTIFVSTDWDWWALSRRGDILYNNDIMSFDDLQRKFVRKYGSREIDFEKLWIFKVLTGDPSDNISGVPRFPKKLAVDVANGVEDVTYAASFLRQNGNEAWAKKVEAYNWLISRNTDLILPCFVSPDAMDVIEGCFDRDKVGEILLKSGIDSLYDRYIGES
jgi:5'-3' exonuclease